MRVSILALCVTCALAASSAMAGVPQGANTELLGPSGKGYGVPAPQGQGKPVRGGGGNGISYHGGPVITGTTNVHFIWYGLSGWPNATQKSILENYPSGASGSPYYNINTTYYNGSNVHVSNSVHFSGSVGHSETYGATL